MSDYQIPDWEILPEIILVQIFSYLSTIDKCGVCHVCPKWAQACGRPGVWNVFKFSENDLRKMVTHFKTESASHRHLLCRQNPTSVHPWISLLSDAIKEYGKYFKTVCVEFRGSQSSQILNCLAECCTHIVVLKIRRLGNGVNVIRNHCSSGKQALYTLCQRNCSLQHCEFRDIDSSTVTERMEPFPLGPAHSATMKCLYFFQSFYVNNMGNLMYLVNLRELALEPNLLSFSLLHHLASHSLQDLHIVAVPPRAEYYNEALQNWHWKSILAKGPKLGVHCHFGVGQDWTEKEVMLKEAMPVRTMKYTKLMLLNYVALSPLICKYSATLEQFIDFSLAPGSYSLARTSTASSICTISQHLFNIVRDCVKLRRLTVKEVLSSTVVLAMLYLNSDLEILLMENQILFGQHPLPDDCFPYDIAKLIGESSGDIHAFEAAVLAITGRQWMFVSEAELHDLILGRHPHFI